MEAPVDIRIADFDYILPEARIASHPCEPRDACRLLVREEAGHASHHVFTDLPDLLPPGSLMVCNNTRVINARIRIRKSTGPESDPSSVSNPRSQGITHRLSRHRVPAGGSAWWAT